MLPALRSKEPSPKGGGFCIAFFPKTKSPLQAFTGAAGGFVYWGYYSSSAASRISWATSPRLRRVSMAFFSIRRWASISV